MRIGKFKINHYINYMVIGLITLVMGTVSLVGGRFDNSLLFLMEKIAISIILAVSLSLVVGFLGELSLGHAGFMCVGAYLGGKVATMLTPVLGDGILSFLVALVVGCAAAAACGVIIGIPALRLRGDYLAIVTLAFGEIIRNILQVLYIGKDANGVHFAMSEAALDMAEGGKMIVRGPMGVVGIQKISTLTMGFILVMITLVVVLNLIRSRQGRAIMAMRDNRIAAESIGISIAKYKIMAFVTSAVLAGASGALYAMNFSSILPKKFDFNTSILILVFVVLGGMGNNGCSEDHFVNRYEAGQSARIAELETEVKLRDANAYTLGEMNKIRNYVDAKFDSINAQLCSQAVVNAQVTANLSCLQNTVATLSGMTKTVIPIANICPEPMPQYNSWTAPTTGATT